MEYYDQFGDAGGSGICRSASLYAVCAPGRAENGTDGNADRRGRDDRLYCSAITDFVVTFASDADIVNLHNWSRGSFSGMTWENVAVMAGVTFVSAAAVFLLSKPIGAYQMGGDVCEKYGSQCRTSAFLYGDFVQHLIWLRSGICRSGFLCWNRGSASDPLAVCRYKTAGADSGLFPGRKRVLPVQRLAGADGLCPDGIEHQHGNSCLWCAGRDFCDDAETSKEHLKYRAAEEKIP